jgi:hypothetical protein
VLSGSLRRLLLLLLLLLLLPAVVRALPRMVW